MHKKFLISRNLSSIFAHFIHRSIAILIGFTFTSTKCQGLSIQYPRRIERLTFIWSCQNIWQWEQHRVYRESHTCVSNLCSYSQKRPNIIPLLWISRYRKARNREETRFPANFPSRTITYPPTDFLKHLPIAAAHQDRGRGSPARTRAVSTLQQ